MTPHPFRISRLAAIALCIAAAHAHAATDPTVATDAMADVLRQRLTEANGMRMHALVVGSSGEGVALIGPDSTQATAVRRGSRLTQTVDGVKVDVSIKSVTPLGVARRSKCRLILRRRCCATSKAKKSRSAA